MEILVVYFGPPSAWVTSSSSVPSGPLCVPGPFGFDGPSFFKFILQVMRGVLPLFLLTISSCPQDEILGTNGQASPLVAKLR